MLPAFSVGARAAEAEPGFAPRERGELRGIVDATTIELADGRRLRLLGIDAPSRGAFAAEAKSRLQELLRTGDIELHAAAMPDRQGRVPAQLFAAGIWVQGDLVRRGLARVRGTADNREGLRDLLARERQARRYRRGLWSDPAYAVRSAEDSARYAGTFQLVSGQIAEVLTKPGEIRLIFGRDGQAALTLLVAASALTLFRDQGIDPGDFKGKEVLVRGFIDGTRRPEIALTYPEQIELFRPRKTAPKRASGP